MKTIVLNNITYNRLFENLEQEGRFNSPDSIVTNDADNLSWTENDAYPIFLMPNNKIVAGDKGKTHLNYIQSLDPSVRRRFINQIILQGRFWKNRNTFSFWHLTSDDGNNIKTVIRQLADFDKDCFVYYNDKCYLVEYDRKNDYIYLSLQNKTEEKRSNNEHKFEMMEYWFAQDQNFFRRSYFMSTFKKGKVELRELNDYELFCATCYQVWADFLRKERNDVNFTTDDFIDFISQKTKHRFSFNEALDYFHDTMRKKLVPKNTPIDYNTGKETDNQTYFFETLMNECDIDDSQYKIIYYDKSNLPYSYNIKLYNDKDKFANLITNAKANGKFVVDRVSCRKIDLKDNIICSCRIRLKPEYDNYWNN